MKVWQYYRFVIDIQFAVMIEKCLSNTEKNKF